MPLVRDHFRHGKIAVRHQHDTIEAQKIGGPLFTGRCRQHPETVEDPREGHDFADENGILAQKCRGRLDRTVPALLCRETLHGRFTGFAHNGTGEFEDAHGGASRFTVAPAAGETKAQSPL